jgi:hypothetical protein
MNLWKEMLGRIKQYNSERECKTGDVAVDSDSPVDTNLI